MKKIKIWIAVILVCNMIVSGCGTEKAEKDQSARATQMPTTTPTELTGEETDFVDVKLPFQTYMEKYPERLTDAEEWGTAEEGYHWPINLNEELDKLGNSLDTWEERSAMCQIPQEIIESVNTADLLSLALEYPYMNIIIFSNSFFEAINFYAGEFNGWHELLNRPDCYKIVLKYYKKLDIPKHTKSHLNEILPEDATTEDYENLPEEEHKWSSEDLHLKMTIDFCITILCGMTENVDKEMLKRAGTIISKKFSELELTEYNDSAVLHREDLQDASWADQTVVKAMEKSGK